MKFNKIVVTGSNGLLGKAIVRRLSDLVDVICLDIAFGTTAQQYRYVDILSLDALRDAFTNVDAVVHLAALQLGADEERIFALNSVGTWNVFQAAKDRGVRKVVYMSSECATGVVTLSDISPAMPDYLPIDEFHPLKPKDAYGLSKQVGECIARGFVRRGQMEVVVLRPTTVYARGMEEAMREARVSNDPYMWLYVDLEDVATAVHLALDYQGPAYDCFFVSARDTFSQKETLEIIKQRFGCCPEVINPKVYENNPFSTIYDVSRAERILGLNPVSNWRKFLQERRAESVRT